MATVEDARRAGKILAEFDAQFSQHAEAIQELRVAKVSEHHIQSLYPFDILAYGDKLAEGICAAGRLHAVIGELLLLTVDDAVRLLPKQEVGEELQAIENLGNSILSAILALPEKERPGQFILGNQRYPEDFLAAFRLAKKLLIIPIFLRLLADENPDFMRNLHVSPDLGKIERLLQAF